MTKYEVQSSEGFRKWTADDAQHAREQHLDAFPDEAILSVKQLPDYCDECGGTSYTGYPCTSDCDCWGCVSRARDGYTGP